MPPSLPQAGPVRPGELARIFEVLRDAPGWESAALAVSGGTDSTALMVLFADWLEQIGKPASACTVLTVDHGLRAESSAEAESVAARAAALGYRTAILAWTETKPATGLQAAARAARYRLMADYAQEHGIALLVTAHTAEDQSETLLMRLARGSGLDGLSAMVPLSRLGVQYPELLIARPFLALPKARLRATLEQRRIAWIEDPSNQSPAFERSRLRAASDQLEALGLTASMLGLSARRLQRARAAIERWVADFCSPESTNVHVDPCGFIRIAAASLRGVPEEIALRVLSRSIAPAGGSGVPLPAVSLEAIARELNTAAVSQTWTLGRAKISATPESVLIERERGREPIEDLMLAPGSGALWDGRFWVRAGPSLKSVLEVRALGVDGVREVRKACVPLPDAPPTVLRTLPGFWAGAAIVAVPSLSFWAADHFRRELSAAFVGLTGSTGALPEYPS